MWNVVNFSNVELWIHFSPDSVQRCWNFAMGSVLARLFRPDPQDVWIKLSKPVLDKYFGSVQLSDEKLIHQAALVNFRFEEDPTLPPAAQLDFVAQFKLYLLLSARVELAKGSVELLSVHCGDFLGSTAFPSFHSLLQTLIVKKMLRLNFSDYRRWIPKQTFYNIVASGQQLEQLYAPGTKEPHILAYHYLKSKLCLTRLVPNFADSTMYTLFEKRIWSGTEFTFMWPSLCVEELCPPADPQLCPLRKEDFCPFMLWVTLPRDYVKVMTDCTLQSNWNFGMITEQVRYMGDDFNFSFSPRSSLLLHTFNISISQVQGTFRMEDRHGKTGNRMEEHFGTGTTWTTLFISRDLSSWTLGHFQGLCWITLSSVVCIMVSTLCSLYSTLTVLGVIPNFQCWCTFQWQEINEGLSRQPFLDIPKSLQRYISSWEALAQLCILLLVNQKCTTRPGIISIQSGSDNTGAEANINHGFSNTEVLSDIIKLVSLQQIQCNIFLNIHHIPGEKNIDADDLSRGRITNFCPDSRVLIQLVRWYFQPPAIPTVH